MHYDKSEGDGNTMIRVKEMTRLKKSFLFQPYDSVKGEGRKSMAFEFFLISELKNSSVPLLRHVAKFLIFFVRIIECLKFYFNFFGKIVQEVLIL